MEIKIIVYLGNVMQGKETAEYDYDTNEVNIKYYNSRGEVVNSEINKIESRKIKSGDVINEFGDIIKSGNDETR